MKIRSNPLFPTDLYKLTVTLADYWRELATEVNKHSQGIVAVSAPDSATSPGTPGQIAYDANYIYLCVETDTWKRASLATWP